MFWVIRGTDARTDEDFAMVVEARSRAAAEAWALKRNVPYIMIDEAADEDVREAKRTKRLWKHTRDGRYTCFGRPVRAAELTCLLVAGLATIMLLLLRVQHLPVFT
jgi:hypothetical protein